RRSSPRRAPSGAPVRTGPFCSNDSTLLTPLTAADDVLVGGLALLTGAVPEGRHAPGRYRVTACGRRTLTTTVWVVNRVHRDPAGLRTHAHVALASGLTDLDVLMVGVTD